MVFTLCARLDAARGKVPARIKNIESNHYIEAIVRARLDRPGHQSWKSEMDCGLLDQLPESHLKGPQTEP